MPRASAKPTKPKTKDKVRAAVQSAPRFLTIALELREIVYEHVLRDSPSSLTDLLTVNRQLSTEVLPYHFKRHIEFDGQAELFDWLDNVDHDYLHHVVDISFRLHDIDPRKIVGALGKRLRQANIPSARDSPVMNQPDGNPYHEACDMELRKVAEAFKLIPNVKKLTITTTGEGDPEPPQRMLSTFSRMLAHRFPQLQTIIDYEDSLPVDFLANKPSLRKLRFPAISTSTNAEVHQHFSSLRLTDLEVWRLAHHDPSAPKRRILSQVLRSLPPLQSLLLRDDPDDEPDIIYEAFVHCDEALTKHKASLRRLTFSSDVGEDMDDDDEEWLTDSREALRTFLVDESTLRRVPGSQSTSWQVWTRM